MNKTVKDIAKAIHTNNKGSTLLPKNQEVTRLIIVEACRTIIDMMKAGDTVFVGELGKFRIKWTPERTMLHPTNGKMYTVPAHYKACFSMMKRIRDEIAAIPYMGDIDLADEDIDETEEVT